MAVWMVRGGRDGAFEQLALDQGLTIIGWAEMPDLSKASNQPALRAMCEKAYPDAPRGRISNLIGRLWSFRERMKPGDLVVMPLRGRAAVAVGEIAGPYEYRPDLPERATHVRGVKWLRTDVARTALDQELLQSLSGRGTLGEIRIDRAEERVRAILAGTHRASTTATGKRQRIADAEYGSPINFRGLRHAPINEQGVIYLFGLVADDLGFLVEAISASFPDCEAKRRVDRRRDRWQRVYIGFEFRSRNFLEHRHDASKCDIVVCWEHDWPDCPLEVIELRELACPSPPDRGST